jgi:hypothetical protein
MGIFTHGTMSEVLANVLGADTFAPTEEAARLNASKIFDQRLAAALSAQVGQGITFLNTKRFGSNFFLTPATVSLAGDDEGILELPKTIQPFYEKMLGAISKFANRRLNHTFGSKDYEELDSSIRAAIYNRQGGFIQRAGENTAKGITTSHMSEWTYPFRTGAVEQFRIESTTAFNLNNPASVGLHVQSLSKNLNVRLPKTVTKLPEAPLVLTLNETSFAFPAIKFQEGLRQAVTAFGLLGTAPDQVQSLAEKLSLK